MPDRKSFFRKIVLAPALAALLLLVCVRASAVAPGVWKTYTSKRSVTALAADSGGVVWAASSGGLFEYRPASAGASLFRGFTTSEGLQSTDLTALALDRARRTLWIGAVNGMIDRYDIKANTWEHITDISSLTTPNKRINALTVQGDSLFIMSDLGVHIYEITAGQFGDTYGRFGTGAGQIIGNATAVAVFGGRIWVGTKNGLAFETLGLANPIAPENWQIHDTSDGLPSSFISGLAVFSNTLYAATDAGIAAFDGTRWTTVPGTAGLNIVDLSVSQDLAGQNYLLFVTPSGIWMMQASAPGAVIPLSAGGEDLTTVAAGNPAVAGSSTSGLIVAQPGLPQNAAWETFLPSGPYSNKFNGIAVDNNGVFWSATGQAGEGIMSFDGTEWKSYRVADYPILGSDNFFKISIGANNAKWAGNWGAGVVLFDGRGAIKRSLNYSNGLPNAGAGTPVNPAYVVVGGVATDASGTAWITDRTPPPDTAIVLFHPDSTVSYIRGISLRSPAVILNDVVIDQYNTKWFTNYNRFENTPPVALYFYTEGGVQGFGNGQWGRVTSQNGLTSNQVWSLALGKQGELWVGTDQGISIIFDTQFPGSVAAYHPLEDQIIQAIVTDALDNKWVATKNGVFIMSSDGTSIVDHYTVESTGGKLLNNDVTSIAIDGNSGTVYFGTEQGLSSLSTSSVNPVESFGDLKIYPNPFILPAAAQMTVDGLVDGTMLKIMTVSGKLVRGIQTPGGRVGYWDGRNDAGEFVASGVYIVIAASADGKKTATGKVAVIRK